jgi:ATP-dependent DNA ligase
VTSPSHGRQDFVTELGKLLAMSLPRIAPMKAVTGELPTAGDGWAAEVKWDGQLH